MILWVLPSLVLAYLSSKAWNVLSEWLKFRQATKTHGCKRPNRVRDKDPILGLDFYPKMMQADNIGQLAQFFYELHKTYGKTFQYNVLGKRSIHTSLPENIRAVAVSQFEDFGVEPLRGNNTAPFMEKGVFTHDGEFWKESKSMIKPIFDRAEVADLDNFEVHVSRFLDLIPKDSSTFDIRSLLKRLVGIPNQNITEQTSDADSFWTPQRNSSLDEVRAHFWQARSSTMENSSVLLIDQSVA